MCLNRTSVLILLLATLASLASAQPHGITVTIGLGVPGSARSCPDMAEPTTTFYSSDAGVYIVVKVLGGTTDLLIQWFAPPGGSKLYRSERLRSLASYQNETVVCRVLPIKGTEVAGMLGEWTVRVSVPGTSLVEKRGFRIEGGTRPVTGTQPGPGVPAPRGCLRPAEGATWREVVATVRRSVVFIEGETADVDERGNKLYAHGSGVIISPDGYVLTAAHVVDGIVGPIHVLVDEQEWFEAELVKIHPKWDPKHEEAEKELTADIALLKIKGASGLPCAVLGDSDRVVPEEEIRLLGYPRAGEYGLGLVVGSGKVLGVRHFEGYSYLQIDVSPFDKGHSGGPVINARGEVVGLAKGVEVTEVLVFHQFAVAINTAKEIIPTWIAVGDQQCAYAMALLE